MYTAISACFPWFHTSLEFLKCECVDNLFAFLRGSPQLCQNDALSALISPWGIGKSRRGRGQAITGVGNYCNVSGSQELSNNEWCVSGHVVMVEKSIVFLPLVWKFAPNALPQPLQTLTVKLAIDGLTRGYEFHVDNVLDVEKNINMDLTLLRTWRAFFGRGEFGDFHCDDCCLVSGT